MVVIKGDERETFFVLSRGADKAPIIVITIIIITIIVITTIVITIFTMTTVMVVLIIAISPVTLSLQSPLPGVLRVPRQEADPLGRRSYEGDGAVHGATERDRRGQERS